MSEDAKTLHDMLVLADTAITAGSELTPHLLEPLAEAAAVSLLLFLAGVRTGSRPCRASWLQKELAP